MKREAIFVAFVLCVAMLFVVTNTSAQNQRVGTVGGTELLVPVGARDMALSGSSIATSVGVEAMFWNPGGLGRLNGSAEGMFSTMSYIGDINVSYGAVAGKFGEFGTVGFSIKSIGFGDILITSEEDPEGNLGRYFSPTYVTAGLTYSRAITDAISFGTTIKVISESIDRVSASGFAVDFGVQYRGLVGVNGLNLGVALKNVGPGMKFDGPGLLRDALAVDGERPQQKYKVEAGTFEIPALVEIGITYDYTMTENFDMSVNGTFSNNNLYYDEYRGGVELGFKMEGVTLFGRGGFSSVPQDKDNAIFGSTFGAGINYVGSGINFTFDYAYRQVEFFSGNQVMSFKFIF